MGTRADFYIGTDPKTMEWLGSIGWDGYPEGIPSNVLSAASPGDFRIAVDLFFREREDRTLPDDGWPWPWDDSRTTDYAYAWDDERRVVVSCFGSVWEAAGSALQEDWEPPEKGAKFPDMTARQNVRWDKGSGLIVVTLR